MGLSRNKVAVPEGAAGSPPFYGVFRTPVVASVVWPMRREWFPVSRGRAGVEEIMGFRIPFRGSGEWYGYAFGLPDRHPRLVVACGFRMPLVGRRGPVGPWVGSCRGAWWFENWIVDASNAMIFCHRLLYRDFARLFFGVWFRDRSFCDHFLQCDDLSSGV